MSTGGGFGIRIGETVAEDILAGRDGTPQPQLDRRGLRGGRAGGAAAVEEKVAIGVYTASEVKGGAREKTQVGVRVYAEIEDRHSYSLGITHRCSFASGSSG